MTEPLKIKGHLIINVAEATGKNKEDQLVWDPNFVEGFVKVEIRGGPKNIKVQSAPKRVLANSINWQEELILNVVEGATELRLMLCREKRSGTRVGTSVIAACGIFVNDILDAVPIDKYFELFKPGQGGEGGFIRISMDYVKDLNDRKATKDGAKAAPTGFKPSLSFKGYTPDNGKSTKASATNDTDAKGKPSKKRGFPILKFAIVAAALGFAGYQVAQSQGLIKKEAQEEKKKEEKKKFPW